ncbi:MAG: caspase family protein, partial [Bacteroidota bacterium]
WNQAQLWNIKGTSFRSLRSVNSSVAHLSFDEDYRIITAGRVNLSKGRQPTESDVANARSTLFARSPNGQNFLSGTLENVQVWNLNEPGNVPQSYNPAGTIRPSRQIFLKDLEGTVQARFTMEDTPSYVLSYTPDGQGFLVGVGNDIVYYNLQGQKIRTYRGHTKPVRSLAFTPDGRHFATGSEDFSTQIWSFDQPKAIAAIALQRPGIWAVLEPTGLFDASDSAMQQVSYNCFYGNEELTISLQQLKQRYYEPGLLAVLLGRSTFALRNVPDIQSLKLYPRINVLDRLNGRMNIFLRPRNGGIGKVSLYLNGVEVEEDINPNRLNDLRVNLLQYDAFLNADIDLDNIVLKVYNEEGWLVSAGIFLNSRGPSDTYAPGNYTGILPGDYTNDYPINRLNPKIHILSIGTSDYRGSDLDLAFADQDAQSMAIALATAGQKLFRSWRGADVFCLTTTQNDSLSMMQENIQWDFASKQQIEQSIKAIGDSARPEDIVVLFLAGHGLSRHEENGSKFYYLNQGIDSELMLDDPVLRAKHTISSEEMTHWLKAIKAKKKILIIDACNAGRMIEEMAVAQTRSVDPAQIRAFDRMKDRTGMYILSGSASDKVSYESTEFGHGLLTYALLNGMRGSATKKMPDGKQLIDVMRLFQFVVDEVPALANRIKGIQTPVLSVPANASSFDIGLVDETVIIPMSINKPVIKRSAFLDKDSFNDRLSLAEQLSSLFSEENSKGQNANFVFIDVNDYP